MKKIYKVCSIILAMTSLALMLTACGNKDTVSVKSTEKLKTLKMADSQDEWINMNVYFDGSTDANEVKVMKEERIIQREELLGEIIMQELIKGPAVASELKPIFHKDTKLLSFSIKDGIAYINLSDAARYDMTEAKEEACLRSIALSLTELPSVNKIKLLIDNRNVETLGGNFDISKAFSNDDIVNIKK